MKVVRKASACAKFRLLMWKNFLMQWRQRWQTLTEILLPVGTMALVLIIRSQIEPVSRDTFHYPPLSAHSINYISTFSILSNMDPLRISLAYSPTSPVLEDVLFKSVRNLLNKNAEDWRNWINGTLPDWVDEINLPPGLNVTEIIEEILQRVIRIHAYDSASDLDNVYQYENATQEVLAAVQFDDSLYNATELADDMSYSLRFPERPRWNSFFSRGSRSWRTDLTFPLFPSPGPRSPNNDYGGGSPGYVIEMFVALQYSISTELISRLTDTNLWEFPLAIQRYPHPAYHEDMAVDVLQLLFSMFMMLSFSYTAVNIVKAVTYEKEHQLKESMKIMGLPTWLHWTAWFCKHFIFLVIMAVFIVILLKVHWFTNSEGYSNYSVFTNTPSSVLFFFIVLYMTCTIFFCFMMSGIFAKANTAALFTAVIWFLTYTPAILLAMDVSMSTAVQAITCLSINTAMAYGFQLILAQEATGGLQWSEFFVAPTTEGGRLLFGHVVIMMVISSSLYMLIALYLEQVRPGLFGVPQPWYFPFQPSFWCQSSQPQLDITVNELNTESDLIKENDPKDHAIGVHIAQLTKIFGKNAAVDNLSLNIYNDQITVLLGHNGAGKSTTISMLTGNLQPTIGSILIAGYDVSKQCDAARSHIGLCPQHNVLFNELTVKEHMEFFARLKGLTGKDLTEDIDDIIEKLELQDKRDYKASGLSGGQKRRLSVGVALCGGSRVVLLDEPTSGMDPSSRRALWNLLQQEKKGRAMILTTHFMDEADILGDRVAIMATGRLQCVGSPYFLKQHYGVGYTLIVVKEENFKDYECTKIIAKYIPGIGVKEDRGSEVTYSLTDDFSHVFEDILNDLEDNRAIIGYKNYGLDATTMEDVFLRVGSDVATSEIAESDDCTVSSDATANEMIRSEYDIIDKDLFTQEGTVSGARLWMQQVLTTWLKLWLVSSRSYGLLIMQFLVPIIQINATLLVLRYVMNFVEVVRSRPLSLATGYTDTETLLAFNGTNEQSLGALAASAFNETFLESDVELMSLKVTDQPLDDYYLEQAASLSLLAAMRYRVVIGATFAEEAATAWFSNFGYHDVATSLATLQSSLLRAMNVNATINVFNHPLETAYTDQTDMQTMVTMMAMQVASGIGSSIGIASAVFIMFYIKERVSRAKLLQKASGVQPFTLWFSSAIFDWIWFLVISLTVIATCAAYQVIGLSTGVELGRLFLCFMLYGAAMIPLTYTLSHVFSTPTTGFVLNFFIGVLFGMMGAQIVEALFTPGLNTEHVAEILDYILQFYPLYSLVISVRKLNTIGLTNWSCMQLCDMVSLPIVNQCNMETLCNTLNIEACCVREDPFFDWEEPGILRYIVAMIVSCILMWTILMMIEYRVLKRLFTRRVTAPSLDESLMDEDVVLEKKHVEQIADSTLGKENLVAKSLTKYYGKHLAVNQVSFTVAESECFGLLGVNGAGKTTTFKMLMGDETVSSGDAFVKGYSVKKDLRQVHANIGYCPQFDAVFDELTGRETLRFFALLRGLKHHHITALTRHLAGSLGFTKHLDKMVKQYSGGNKRKLSTAVAMMGYSSVIFLDEPTTGVDPAAKRQVWHAIRHANSVGRGVVLTSHSMEECEALCSRLSIMVNGQFQCLGSPQYLKNKFSQGFTLTIKMKIDGDIDTPNSDLDHQAIEAVKAYVSLQFEEPKLMEEYKGFLTYYLKNNLPWSRMFGVMELAKRELKVEDYSISQTTLEQIFLQFTKYQQQGA